MINYQANELINKFKNVDSAIVCAELILRELKANRFFIAANLNAFFNTSIDFWQNVKNELLKIKENNNKQ